MGAASGGAFEASAGCHVAALLLRAVQSLERAGCPRVVVVVGHGAADIIGGLGALLIAVGLALLISADAGSLIGLSESQTASLVPLLVLLVVAAALTLVGRAGLRRRDIDASSPAPRTRSTTVRAWTARLSAAWPAELAAPTR